MKIIFKVIVLIMILLGMEVKALYINEGEINNNFKTEKYYIKLNGNGGTFSKQNNIIVFQKHITLPTPTKEGYIFSHYTCNTGSYSTEIDDVNNINNEELLAKWNLNKYKIFYNLNGGNSNELINEYTVEDEFTLPIPIKEESTFIGWITKENITPIKELKVLKGTTGDLYFEAKWLDKTYNVKVVSVVDNIIYDTSDEYYTYNIWINDELIKENVSSYEDEVPKGSKIRVQALNNDGIETTYDKTIILNEDYIFYPEWTINEYESEFYVDDYLAGVTINKFGSKVGTPAINLENYGYSNYFFYISGFTPRETWYQKAYTLYFDTNIEQFPCMTSFGSGNLNNAYQQLSILQQNGINFCGVNPSWNAVECHGNSMKVLDLYNKVWNLLPYSGSGYSRYKQMSCNSGYATSYNR